MADCITTIKKIIFDVSDEQMTKVRIEIDFAGDCPIQMKRVYEKSFPARLSVVDILTMESGGVQNYLEW